MTYREPDEQAARERRAREAAEAREMAAYRTKLRPSPRYPGKIALSVLGVLFAVGVVVLGWFIWLISHMGAPGRPVRWYGRLMPSRLVTRRRTGRRAHFRAWLRLAPVDERSSVRLARLWLSDALAEQASVAAFEHLARDLEEAGACSDLVALARRAALEETGHAEACLSIASAYAGRSLRVSLSPLVHRFELLRRKGGEPRTKRIRRLVVESLLDGVINEGASAKVARMGARTATDPIVAMVLTRVAEQEEGHAELARRVVLWGVNEDRSVLPALHAALRASERTRASGDPDDLVASGRVGKATRSDLVGEARDEARRLVASLGGV